MTSQFIAKPPLALKGKSLLNYVWRGGVSFGYILWQVVVPFKSSPEEIERFPEPVVEVDDQQVKQSQWIFDQAEERRVHLEQKAQSTFGLMLFLVPLLASLFVFMGGKVSNSGGASRNIAVILLAGSAVFLFLGFISAVRAVGIRNIEALYLGSVLDESGQFRKYSKAFHAYGLLYCAAMNQAMNDHRAQFVKGAQLFTAVAVVGLVITAIPVGLVLSRMPSSPSETKIVGPVDISSEELRGLRDDLRSLKADVQTLLSNRQLSVDRLQDLEPKTATVDPKSNQPHAKQSVTMGSKRKAK